MERRPNFEREIRAARARGDEQAAEDARRRAREWLKAKGREQARVYNLRWGIRRAGDAPAWHRAARAVVEAAPEVRWPEVLHLLIMLMRRKPQYVSRPLWRQMQAVTRRALEQCVAGFAEKVGRDSPEFAAVGQLHWVYREIVDEIRAQPAH